MERAELFDVGAVVSIRKRIDGHMRELAGEDERRLRDALLVLVAEDGEHGVSAPRRLIMRRWQHRPLDGASPHLEEGRLRDALVALDGSVKP